MSFLFFILFVLFFILYLTKKPKGDGLNYDQGYWDGYRALGDKIRLLLRDEKMNKESIQQEINRGYGDSYAEENLEVYNETPLFNSEMPASTSGAVSDHSSAVVSKEDQSVKNLNTLLFVASLLFVAAGAAFVAAAMPDSIKLAGVWILVVVFYGVGVMLLRSKKLESAGKSFVGTALGLIPFAGFALYQLTDMPAAAAWSLTSFIGIVAYFWAAIRLQSQIVSYLTLAFVVSLAASFGDTVGMPLVWSFVLVILVSLIATVMSTIKPKLIPALFNEPIERTGQIVTPVALLLSLSLVDRMSIVSYELLFGVATLHYAVAWLQSKQVLYESLTRGLFHMTVLILACDITDEKVAFGIVFLIMATLQQSYSLIRMNASRSIRSSVEQGWIYAMQLFQLFACLLWLGESFGAELSTLALTLIGISSLLAALRSRVVALLSTGIFASIALPLVVGRFIVTPPLDWGYLSLWFVMIGIVLAIAWGGIVKNHSRLLHQVNEVTVYLYLALGAVIALTIDQGWSAGLLFSISLILWVLSYLFKHPVASIVGSVLFTFALAQLWQFLELDMAWIGLGVAWTAAVVFYGAHYLISPIRDTERSIGLLGMTWVVLVIGVILTFFSEVTQLASAVTVVIAAVTVMVEGRRREDRRIIETGIYIASFGAQRMVSILAPELNVVFYAHWWALTIAAVALWRRQFHDRAIIAVAFVTLATGVYALSEGGMYQLLFLVEHLALLIAGVLLGKRWAIWWGLVASSLAVLYFLKDIAFLAFGFLGIVVIGIVIWRLNSSAK